MTRTPIPRLVIALSIPTTVSQLVTVLYNTVDAYFVSKINISATGAIGVAFSAMSLIQAFGYMQFVYAVLLCLSLHIRPM